MLRSSLHWRRVDAVRRYGRRIGHFTVGFHSRVDRRTSRSRRWWSSRRGLVDHQIVAVRTAHRRMVEREAPGH